MPVLETPVFVVLGGENPGVFEDENKWVIPAEHWTEI
jgi:hypothetical protein